MRKVKIEQGSVIDSDLDHSISSEQPFSLQKSEPMPKEAVSRYWSRKKRYFLQDGGNKTCLRAGVGIKVFPVQKEKCYHVAEDGSLCFSTSLVVVLEK